MFFSLDGIDGVGKSTQIELFRRWLTEQGFPPVTCRDPGSTEMGERIRGLLLDPASERISLRTEMLLYMASRAQLVDELIRPALEAGRVVVSDRYLLANVVYQGHAGGLDVESLWQIGAVATGGLTPDLTFVLDLDPAQAASRLSRELDRLEQQTADVTARRRAGFLTEAQRSPDRILVLDAARSVDEIQADIRRAAAPLLARHAASVQAGARP
jgi:dTMP kinase